MTNVVQTVLSGMETLPQDTWAALSNACVQVLLGVIAIVKWCLFIA